MSAWEAAPDQNTAPQGTGPDNVKKFLGFLRKSEVGTDGIEGYGTIYGGGRVTDFKDHPRKVQKFKDTTGQEQNTTAAGGYQFLSGTWDSVKRDLNLPDFGPESQDRAAVELIRRAGALEDVQNGNYDEAIKKLGSTWASLPSSPYPQPKRSADFVKAQLGGGQKAAGGWEQAPEVKQDNLAVATLKGLASASSPLKDLYQGELETLITAPIQTIGDWFLQKGRAHFQAAKKALTQGTPYKDTFDKEFQQATGHPTVFDEYLAPRSETGKALTELMGKAMDFGIHALGNSVREKGYAFMGPGFTPGLALQILKPMPKEDRETAAFWTEEGATAGLVLAPLVGGVRGVFKSVEERSAARLAVQKAAQVKMQTLLEKDVPQFMQTYYPETWARMTAGQVGKVELGMPGGVELNITREVINSLNEMGVPKDTWTGKSLSELIRLAIDTADKTGEINGLARSTIVENYMRQVDHLSAIERAMDRQTLLPPPAALEGQVEVTGGGRAGTRQQWGEFYTNLSNEQRAEAFGVGPMGVLRTRVDAWERAKRGIAEGNSEQAVKEAYVSAKRAFEQAFPLGRNRPGISAAQRAKVFDEWMGQGAPYMPYDEIAKQVYARVPRKQAGMVELPKMPDLQNVEQTAREAAKEAVRVSPLSSTQRTNAEEIGKIYDNVVRGQQKTKREIATAIGRATVEKSADPAATLKHLLRVNGGEDVVNKMVAVSGATKRAEMHFNTDVKPIFGDLNREEVAHLNKMVLARIDLELLRKNPKYVRHGVTDATKIEDYIRDFRDQAPEVFRKLDSKADQIFTVYRKYLERLYDRGLLDDKSFSRLYNFEWNKTEYYGLIDPAEHYRFEAGEEHIPASGVDHPIKIGKDLITDPQVLLFEHIARVENRIMKNESTRALARFAEVNKDNPAMEWVRPLPPDTRAPDGYTRVTYMENGKRRAIALDEDLAHSYLKRPYVMDNFVANLFHWTSAFMKGLVVTYNPLWPIKGFPMDVGHMYLAGKGYSSNPVVFMGQLGRDLGAVAKDAITHGPRYKQAIEEGMGFDFMTAKSKPWLAKDPFERRMNPRWEQFKMAAKYLSETQELWIRLAHRERLMRMGYSGEAATAIAKERLDFSSGGVLSKAMEMLFPYSNVAAVATHSVMREARANPGAFARKMGWVSSIFAGVTLYQIMQNPEAWKALSTYDKVNSFPFLIPTLDGTDKMGMREYAYIPVRVDQTLVPLKALVTAAIEKSWYGEVVTPDLASMAAKQLPSALGSGGMIGNPLLQAMMAYVQGVDPRYGGQIWTGIKVPPELEYKGEAAAHPSTPLEKTLGLLGISPGRGSAALQAFMPNNPWTDLATWTLNKALETQPQVREQTRVDMLKEAPFLRSVIKFGTPISAEVHAFDQAMKDYGGKIKPLYDVMDSYAVRFAKGQVTQEDVATWLKAQPPEYADQLKQRFRHTAAFEKVATEYKMGDGVPSRVWWQNLMRAPAEVRAKLFYETWVSAEPEDRRRMETIAGALHKQGIGFQSDNFRRHFGMLQQQYGQEQR